MLRPPLTKFRPLSYNRTVDAILGGWRYADGLAANGLPT